MKKVNTEIQPISTEVTGSFKQFLEMIAHAKSEMDKHMLALPKEMIGSK
jgi:hypothetical protein